jgi:thiol-disulfide isomerase/thioredoxin
MKTGILILAGAALATLGVSLALKNSSSAVSTSNATKPSVTLKQKKLAPDFILGGEWLNSKPLSIKALRGKVVIVNIWVHSCINCHNSLPTLVSWYKKYKDQGLEIVGVHTPEFESDKNLAQTAASLKEDGVTWPVMQDNNEATWKAYNNQFWPAFYIVDRNGMIRSTHAGEISSRYPNAIPGLEADIQKLLAEKAQ